MGHSLLVLNLLDGAFPLNSSLKQLQIALLFRKFSLLSQALLLLVVLHEFNVALTIQNLALLLKVSLFFLIQSPLSLEHLAFGSKQIILVFPVHLSCLLLPFKNGKGIRRYFLFLQRFLNFALSLLLSIELIQLSINLLFHHLLLDVTSLVD